MKKISTKILIFFLFCLVFLKKQEVSDAVFVGVNIWYKHLLPSLLPFFIFTDLFISSGVVNDLCKKVGPLFSRIFNVSKYSLFIFFISLTSGSPTNAKIIKNMMDNGYILRGEAEKILCFSMFYNPFLIYSITNLYLSKTDSIKVVFITYLTNILIGLILRFKKVKINNLVKNISSKTLLVDSIKDTMMALISILGTIITMMVLIALVKTGNIYIDNIFNGFLEITSGIINLSVLNINYNLKLIFTIMYLSFGGLSIHMQIKSILKDTISYKMFYKTRILAILISLFLLACIT